jgi:periplasmic divalent cation tolerance protein
VSPDEFVVVLVTASSADEAAHIGRAVVEDRLAACANVVGPIRSIYRWEDAVEDAPEHLLVIKARAADFGALEALVVSLHSYDVPEVIALPLRAGSAPYLDWLAAATQRDG